MTPDFDELVGFDVEGPERERLRRVHDLLVQAGPPAEISPELAAGPALGLTLGRRRPKVRRTAMLLAAAVAALALAFLGGYVAGNGGGGGASVNVLKLSGTPAAPNALASLEIEHRDAAGNWPMKLAVTGLPALPPHSYYEVYLVRGGKPWGSCGSFVVSSKQGTTIQLNAPYRLRPGDSWVVTRQALAQRGVGPVVLRPTQTT